MTLTVEPTARPGRGRHQSRLETIERLIRTAEASGVVAGHPLPDLTGADPVEVANALATAIVAAHGGDWPSPQDDQSSVQLCSRCLATVETAAAIAQRNDPPAWPNPLLVVIDEALELRHSDDVAGSR